MKQPNQQLKDAFFDCRWCGGTGCMGCDEERRKYEERMAKPIFSADRNDPEDMAALCRVAGRETLEHAFGPDGNGMTEIRCNAATRFTVCRDVTHPTSREELPWIRRTSTRCR